LFEELVEFLFVLYALELSAHFAFESDVLDTLWIAISLEFIDSLGYILKSD
jgi:hypothetical protein